MADTEGIRSLDTEDKDEHIEDAQDKRGRSGKRKGEIKSAQIGGSSKKGARATHKGTDLIHPKEAWLQDQRVNVYCKPKILELLKMKTTSKQKKMLRKSFVSNFFSMPTTNFPTQLLLQIIRRRIPSTAKGVLRFNIEGNELDFTLADFGLITGLNCGEVKYVNIEKLPPSQIASEFFTNYSAPKFVTLKEKIEGYEFKDDVLSLKLAKLAILEGIVVAKIPSNKLEPLHLRLVEDNSLFETYPWGSVAYKLLFDSIVGSVSHQHSSSMAVSGFAYALIYWAYEVIPKLSENEGFGRRLRSVMPRILNWDLHRLVDGKKLANEIFNEKIVVVPLEPTEDEVLKMHGNKGKEKVDAEWDYDNDNISEEDWHEMDEARQSEASDYATKTSLSDLQALIIAEFTSLNEKVDRGFEDLRLKLVKLSEGQRLEDDHLPFPRPTASPSQFNNQGGSRGGTASPNEDPLVDLPHATPTVSKQLNNEDPFVDLTRTTPIVLEVHHEDGSSAQIPTEQTLPTNEQPIDADPNTALVEENQGGVNTIGQTTQEDGVENDTQEDAQDTAEDGTNLRPVREKKVGRQNKEPYTSAFGSNESKKMKSVVETRASAQKRGRGAGGGKRGRPRKIKEVEGSSEATNAIGGNVNE